MSRNGNVSSRPPLSYALLVAICLRRGATYGTEVIDDIEEITGYRPSQTSVYRALNKLYDEALADVEEIMPDPDDLGGKKRIYELTEEGNDWLGSQVDYALEMLVAYQEGDE